LITGRISGSTVNLVVGAVVCEARVGIGTVIRSGDCGSLGIWSGNADVIQFALDSSAISLIRVDPSQLVVASSVVTRIVQSGVGVGNGSSDGTISHSRIARKSVALGGHLIALIFDVGVDNVHLARAILHIQFGKRTFVFGNETFVAATFSRSSTHSTGINFIGRTENGNGRLHFDGGKGGVSFTVKEIKVVSGSLVKSTKCVQDDGTVSGRMKASQIHGQSIVYKHPQIVVSSEIKHFSSFISEYGVRFHAKSKVVTISFGNSPSFVVYGKKGLIIKGVNIVGRGIGIGQDKIVRNVNGVNASIPQPIEGGGRLGLLCFSIFSPIIFRVNHLSVGGQCVFNHSSGGIVSSPSLNVGRTSIFTQSASRFWRGIYPFV